MRKALIVGFACSSAVTHAPPPSHEEPVPPLPAPVVATPTDDALPDSAEQLAELDGDGYTIAVYTDGMVGWHGSYGVQSIGDRRGRIPDTQVKALARVLDDAKLATLKAPDDGRDCDAEPTTITYWPPKGDYATLTDDSCGFPELEAKVLAYTGADLWIHGNPGGTMPDGDHLLLSYDETACYGTCPVYSFLVFDDGTLIWHGESNVSVTGDKRATLPADRVAALEDAFAKAGWLPPPTPDGGVGEGMMMSSCTDTPHTMITYQRGKQHQSDDNAHCDGDWDFDDHILALAGVDTWVHAPVEVLSYQESGSDVVTVNDVGDVAGAPITKLTSDQLQALDDAFAQAKFFDLPEKTDHGCTGHPETKITFTKDNQTHSVIDFHCKENGSVLADLEKTIHELLAIK